MPAASSFAAGAGGLLFLRLRQSSGPSYLQPRRMCVLAFGLSRSRIPLPHGVGAARRGDRPAGLILASALFIASHRRTIFMAVRASFGSGGASGRK
jgi:hypothetical protein